MNKLPNVFSRKWCEKRDRDVGTASRYVASVNTAEHALVAGAVIDQMVRYYNVEVSQSYSSLLTRGLYIELCVKLFHLLKESKDVD